jgi:hypothetical protein
MTESISIPQHSKLSAPDPVQGALWYKVKAEEKMGLHASYHPILPTRLANFIANAKHIIEG